MANQRDKSKRLVGYFATPEEKKALQELAKTKGYSSLADFLRAIATGAVRLPLLLALSRLLFPDQTGRVIRFLLNLV